MISIKSIWESQSASSSQFIKERLHFTDNLFCYIGTFISTGNRMFIMEIKSDESISLPAILRFRGMTVQTLDLDVHRELTILLTDNDLEDIFIPFIENITEEIAGCNSSKEALPKIAGVIVRWKKLFDKAGFNGLSTEQQKGLFGELSLIHELISQNYNADEVINAWTGPDFKDQDFDFGETRMEIKLTSSKHPAARITNERQLTVPEGVKLFLLIYIVEEVKKKGITLPSLISQISTLIARDREVTKVFMAKISAGGYNINDSEFYETEYMIRDERIYLVEDTFPKITDGDLRIGIYSVSYRIELSACEPFRINDKTPGNLIYGY